nr:hypothetical protein [Candidatus Freyarchaeota archaeon]
MGEDINQYKEEIEEAARIIKVSKYIVALTGACVSVASGIPGHQNLTYLHMETR